MEFNSILVTLYRMLLKEQCESLIDIIWTNNKYEHIEKFYNDNKNFFFLEEDFYNSDEVRENNRIRILNACIYIKEYVLPTLVNENVLKKVESKIMDFKIKWKISVDKYLNSDNDKKYIIKHFKSCKGKCPEENLNKFAMPIQTCIMEWCMNNNSLLSEFYYIEDLQKNQISVILNLDPIFIILKNDSFEKKDIINYIENLKKQNKKFKNKIKKNGGQVPNLLLKPSIFGVNPLKVLEQAYDLENDTIKVHQENDNCKLKISVPTSYRNDILNMEFDANTDVIPRGGFEMAVIVGILQLGREQLKKSNKITFTFNQLLDIWGYSSYGRIYNQIKDALFYLMVNTYSVQLPNDRVRDFHIINSINRPENMSSGELKWIVEIDTEIRQQILDLSYTELYSEDLTKLRYELSPILYKILVIDKSEIVNNSINKIKGKSVIKTYTLSEISNRALLSGKPSVRKRKIANSLKELLEKQDSILKDYSIENNGENYTIVYKD